MRPTFILCSAALISSSALAQQQQPFLSSSRQQLAASHSMQQQVASSSLFHRQEAGRFAATLRCVGATVCEVVCVAGDILIVAGILRDSSVRLDTFCVEGQQWQPQQRQQPHRHWQH